ncbi:hypothetical protein CCP2SC5_30057 [Azospirillaceae bacterium]
MRLPYFSQASALLRDRRGVAAVIFALAAPTMIGFVSLGVEVGLWYVAKAKLQHIADAAAMAGDRELAAGTGQVEAVVSLSGHLNGCTSAKKCALDPPTIFRTASSPSIDNGVQVVAYSEINLLFSRMFLKTTPEGVIRIHATGRAAFINKATGGVPGCVLGLDNAAAYTVSLKNNAIVNCNVMSNSKCQGPGSTTCTLDANTYGSYSNCDPSVDPQCIATTRTKSVSSLNLLNNARINATGSAAGTIYLANNAIISGTKIPNSTQVPDPYSTLTVSTPTATAALITGGGNGGSVAQAIDISVPDNTCSITTVTYDNNQYLHIRPGCYNGWSMMNNVHITLDSGTYRIKSKFIISNNAFIDGTMGTTLVFVGSGNNSYAIDINNNAFIKITAPNSGPYQGVAIMGDPNGKPTIVQTFNNNTIFNVKGAIYFRSQIINMENNAISDLNGCLQVIGRRVLLSNNATFGNNCLAIGTKDIMIGQHITEIIDLVE